MRDTASYLEGEMHAVQACGVAITEAVEALKQKFKGRPDDQMFILLEFQGIMIRASQLIRNKNDSLNIAPKIRHPAPQEKQ